jgi:hypothetical protein
MNPAPVNLTKYDLFDAMSSMGDDELADYLTDVEADEAFLKQHHGYHDLYDEELDPELDELLSQIGC